ncbi:MAG TPA: hypothetical protein PKC28_12195, partial [Bdellovibrionales bacterium]|nr:hypothetical protein [Bdellovibrionales bacterium]
MKALLVLAAAVVGFSMNSASAAQCKDGQQTWFTEARPHGHGQVRVLRTCVDGRYYPKKTTKGVRCKEGQQAWFTKTAPRGDGQISELRTCVDGRYYAKTTVKILRCKEGRTERFSYVDQWDRERT